MVAMLLHILLVRDLLPTTKKMTGDIECFSTQIDMCVQVKKAELIHEEQRTFVTGDTESTLCDRKDATLFCKTILKHLLLAEIQNDQHDPA